MGRRTAHPAIPALRRASGSLVPRPDAADEPRPTPGPRSTRDWIVDLTCLLVAVAFGLLGYHHLVDVDTGPVVTTVDVATGSVMLVLLWFRRRWPVQLALLAAITSAYSQTAGGASIILVFTVAVHREVRLVVLVAIAQVPSVLISAAVWPDDTLSYWPLVAFLAVLLGFVVAWGMAIRSRRQLLLSLQERAERAEREQLLLVGQARDHERARIAREMHDVLAHRISLLSLHAGALEFRPDAPPEEIARAAGVIRSSAHEALEDLREVIGVLRDGGSLPPQAGDDAPASETRPQPGLGDLPALLSESRAAGMRIEERLEAVPGSIAGAAGRTAYRVVQEGLTNARKHAWGTLVRVSSSGAPGDGLTVEVWTPAAVGGTERDPGIPGAGTGLIGLQERAALAGGRLESGPTPDGGFLLRAWLPWASDPGAPGAPGALSDAEATGGAGVTGTPDATGTSDVTGRVVS